MTSPSQAISEPFTGTDGAAWANFATNYTQTGVFSTGPSESILTNKGRASGTTSTAPSIRRHRTSGFQYWTRDEPFSVQGKFVRSTLSVKPGLFCLAASSDSTANFIAAQADTFTGKSTTYGLSLKKYVSGTWTALASLTTVTGASSTATTLGIALRTWYLVNSGNLVVQAKLWDASGSEPAWVWPTSEVAGSVTSATGSLVYIMSSAARAADYASTNYYGMFEEMTAAAAYTVDWDDMLSYDWEVGGSINTNFGGLTATANAARTRYAGAETTKEDGGRGSGFSGQTAPASWWTKTGTIDKPNVFTFASSDGTGVLEYDTTSTDHSIGFNYPALPADSYLGKIRYVDANNFVAMKAIGTGGGAYNWALVKVVGGVETTVFTGPPNGFAGIMTYGRLSAKGTKFRVVFKSGNTDAYFKAATVDISDVALQTGTKVRIDLHVAGIYLQHILVGVTNTVNETNFGTLVATATAFVASGGVNQYFGTNPASKLYVGTTQASKVYHGTTQLWP